MLNALRLCDIDTAMQSFSPDVRQRYKALFGSMKEDRLNVFITAFTQIIESIAPLSADLAIGKCRLPDNHGIEVHFMRINERWYITSVA